MHSFKKTAEKYLGSKFSYNELREIGILNMPVYLSYANDNQNELTLPDLDMKSHLKSAMSMTVHLSCSHMKARLWAALL